MMHRSLTLSLAALSLMAAAHAAKAADLRRPAYKASPVVAAYNWSGFYIGLHGGWATGNGNASIAGVTSSGDIDGWFGGGQIGWNWQAPGSPWVFGLEADIAGADIGDSVAGGGAFVSTSTDVFGTARLRLGHAWDRVLWYVTGGLAWANNEVEVGVVALGTVSESNTHVGWTVGGGVEWALVDNWTVKAEYLYIDLGDETYFANSLTPLSLGGEIHTVKLGVNYRFGR